MTTAESHDLGEAHSRLFPVGQLPDQVFRPVVTSCAWVYFDAVCSFDGWSLLSALARHHGDASVQIAGLDLPEHLVLSLPADASRDQYQALCNDELVGSNVVHWWGTSAGWGIHGSRDLEVAVAGRVGDVPWPHVAGCDVLTIDAAIRLARRAGASEAVLDQLLATYDECSWDAAEESPQALSDLVELCRGIDAEQIDPIVAIRRLVALLERVPKRVRRIAATERLHQAWTRTSYLVLHPERDAFAERYGALLLAQNDRNHEQHANDERQLVRQACSEILLQVERAIGR